MTFFSSFDSQNSAGAATRDTRIMLLTVWGFVLFVCLTIVIFQIWRTKNAYSMTMESSVTVNSNLGRALAQHADELLQVTDNMLNIVVEHAENSMGQPAAQEQLHTELVATVADLAQLYSVKIYDSHGIQIASSQPLVDPSESITNSDMFNFHENNAGRRYFLDRPVKVPNTDTWVIRMSRAFRNPVGGFGGVVVASIDADYFRRFYDSFDVGDNGVIALTTLDGKVFFHRPYKTGLVGSDVSQSVLFKDNISKNYTGVVTLDSDSDGIRRTLSYRRLPHYQMVITIGADIDELLHGWLMETALQIAISLVLIAATVWAGTRLHGQILKRTEAEKKLRETQDKLSQLNHSLADLALRDGLTGLSNRRAFDETLHREFRRAARTHRSLALIMIDIDFFKQYNDCYGHLEGDECLKRISRLISAMLFRVTDMAARFGGEEIAVLLPDTDMTGAMTVAEKLLQQVRDLNISHAGSSFGQVTVSAGIHICRDNMLEQSPQDLVRIADQALYVSKARGRNRATGSDDMQEPAGQGEDTKEKKLVPG